MKRNMQSLRRRTVLKTMGGVAVASSAYVGTVGAAQSTDLIAVSPSSLELEEGETGEVTVEIQGPPFGRTDVEITGVPAEPEEFRLEGRNGSETIEIGPVEKASIAEFHASTPNGDKQVVEFEIEIPDPLLAETNADTIVEPVVMLGDDHSEDQFDALEDLDLTDPFTLAVEAPELAGEDATAYAVTAYYDEFGEAPNDRLSGPSVPLSFDDQGIASVTIGSAGTDADVTTWIAPGQLSDDGTLVNQIEVPDGTERFAVETENGGGVSAATVSGDSDEGEFTEREEI